MSAALPTTAALAERVAAILAECGASSPTGELTARTPITGGSLGPSGGVGDVDEAVTRATEAFQTWRATPAPVRGNVVRRLGELLREHKEALGALVSIEAGKIRSEGLGEVQEMIDICDFAVGLSRQLHGLTIASERPGHRLMETWHPMGPCAVITAFNFPVAVWSWNAALALVAGDPVLWKPSDKTPLTAVACDALLRRAAADVGAPNGLNQVLQGGPDVGAALAAHEGVAIVSATGSTRMGRAVAPVVASRFGRLILELGGNNAAVVAPSADLELAVRGIAFSAVGTAGQRCTSLRRLIVHDSVRDELVDRLVKAYSTVPIGDPLADGTLVGPLIDTGAFDQVRAAIESAAGDGGTLVVGGERVLDDIAPDARYIEPAIMTMPGQTDDRAHRDVRAPALRPRLRRLRRRAGPAQRRATGPGIEHLHQRRARGRAVHVGRGLRLRHRQRQHRPVRGRDRRRLRRREGDGRRSGVGLGRLEGLHASGHQHRQLLELAPPRPGRHLRHLRTAGAARLLNPIACRPGPYGDGR